MHRKSFTIKSSSFPHESALSECLAEVIQHRFALVNHLRNARSLVVVTDFSGSETRQTLTTGLLVTSFDDLMYWHHTYRASWRSTERFEGRSIGYKKVRDSSEGDLHRLNRFLRAASNLTGMLVTTSVPADPKFIFSKRGDCSTDELKTLRGQMQDRTFESMRRFAITLSVGLKPLHRRGQDLLWLCDNDDIISNDSIAETAQRYLACHLGTTTGLTTLMGLVTPTELDDKLAAEDALAIPDLAAGGVGEYLEESKRHFGRVKYPRILGLPPDAKTKSTEIALWFGMNRTPLLKVALDLDPLMSHASVHQIRAIRKGAPIDRELS